MTSDGDSNHSAGGLDFPDHSAQFVVVGLVPATHGMLGFQSPHGATSVVKGGWVYIMTNRPNGTLYVGVTNNLARRAWEHREGQADGFTKKYGLHRLVYAERHDEIEGAIRREKSLKNWPRAWKVRLILGDNPEWTDLYDTL